MAWLQQPSCKTCGFWRPPYNGKGHGNCHCLYLSSKSHCMERDGLDSFRGPVFDYCSDIYLPTGPDFGCVHWKAKEAHDP